MEITKHYKNKWILGFEPNKHVYYLGQGKEFEGALKDPEQWLFLEDNVIPSATTILKAGADSYKFAEDNWRSNLVASFADVMYSKSELINMCNLYLYEPYRQLKRAAIIGNMTHEYAEHYALHQMGKRKRVSYPSKNSQKRLQKEAGVEFEEDLWKEALICCLGFRDWVDTMKPEFIQTEFKVLDTDLMYCGTADVDFAINKKRYIGDYKTSAVISTLMFPQIEAYKRAAKKEYNIDYDDKVIIQLSKRSPHFKHSTPYLEVERDWELFTKLLDSYYIIKHINRDTQLAKAS